ncbi:hypothetical protein [Schnuerera sp.]|uniref:hypothetical protein n=1 Tax=Schnuerera sp. TaxID=2794844 RepID=UPI002C45DB40|nr:hypothetical protein [Schnuerera sp.]HSH36080.1 hypothetical protein [Schnuerera sp.]
MIEVMDSINNHFIKSRESGMYEFATNSIKGTFTQTYLVGMYVIIKGSYLNDGIYEIESATVNEIIVKEQLRTESTEETSVIYGSTPPKHFIELAMEVGNFDESKIGLASESIDDYSISFSKDQSWEEIYKDKLNKYRRVYPDIPTANNKLRWQDRW